MKKKGLCSTCVNDKGCTFPRRFPVWQCEEFTGFEPKLTKVKKVRQEKMRFEEGPVVWE
ncbi:hypothetical protein KAW55_06095 [bacterium]|nr:hypothetical protein [bacterium]